jgi:CubicO group peptidase (beta-lactamase class C family)
MAMQVSTFALRLFAALALLTAAPGYADSLDDYLQAEMTKRRIPGLAVAIVDRGKVVKQTVRGLASVELGVPMTARISFPLASLSKVFTGAAVMKLVERGQISLDDPVSKTLTELPPAWAKVTVRQCLDHTTGLPDLLDDGEQLRADDRDVLLRKLAQLPVEPPGARAKYNQTGYMLISMLIERVSGQPFQEFVVREVFKPVDMASTRYADGRDIVPQQTTWYTTFVPSADRRYFAFESGMPVRSSSEIFVNLVTYPMLARAGGGVVSTIGDLIRFEQGLEAGRVLSAESLRATLTPASLADGKANTFSLGWAIADQGGRKLMAFGGANTVAYWRFPDQHVAVIVLTNLQGSEPHALAGEIANQYFRAKPAAEPPP